MPPEPHEAVCPKDFHLRRIEGPVGPFRRYSDLLWSLFHVRRPKRQLESHRQLFVFLGDDLRIRGLPAVLEMENTIKLTKHQMPNCLKKIQG